eukprot:1719380-Prymnesium_polylepis.1
MLYCTAERRAPRSSVPISSNRHVRDDKLLADFGRDGHVDEAQVAVEVFLPTAPCLGGGRLVAGRRRRRDVVHREVHLVHEMASQQIGCGRPAV